MKGASLLANERVKEQHTKLCEHSFLPTRGLDILEDVVLGGGNVIISDQSARGVVDVE